MESHVGPQMYVRTVALYTNDLSFQVSSNWPTIQVQESRRQAKPRKHFGVQSNPTHHKSAAPYSKRLENVQLDRTNNATVSQVSSSSPSHGNLISQCKIFHQEKISSPDSQLATDAGWKIDRDDIVKEDNNGFTRADIAHKDDVKTNTEDIAKEDNVIVNGEQIPKEGNTIVNEKDITKDDDIILNSGEVVNEDESSLKKDEIAKEDIVRLHLHEIHKDDHRTVCHDVITEDNNIVLDRDDTTKKDDWVLNRKNAEVPEDRGLNKENIVIEESVLLKSKITVTRCQYDGSTTKIETSKCNLDTGRMCADAQSSLGKEGSRVFVGGINDESNTKNTRLRAKDDDYAMKRLWVLRKSMERMPAIVNVATVDNAMDENEIITISDGEDTGYADTLKTQASPQCHHNKDGAMAKPLVRNRYCLKSGQNLLRGQESPMDVRNVLTLTPGYASQGKHAGGSTLSTHTFSSQTHTVQQSQPYNHIAPKTNFIHIPLENTIRKLQTQTGTPETALILESEPKTDNYRNIVVASTFDNMNSSLAFPSNLLLHISCTNRAPQISPDDKPAGSADLQQNGQFIQKYRDGMFLPIRGENSNIDCNNNARFSVEQQQQQQQQQQHVPVYIDLFSNPTNCSLHEETPISASEKKPWLYIGETPCLENAIPEYNPLLGRDNFILSCRSTEDKTPDQTSAKMMTIAPSTGVCTPIPTPTCSNGAAEARNEEGTWESALRNTVRESVKTWFKWSAQSREQNKQTPSSSANLQSAQESARPDFTGVRQPGNTHSKMHQSASDSASQTFALTDSNTNENACLEGSSQHCAGDHTTHKKQIVISLPRADEQMSRGRATLSGFKEPRNMDTVSDQLNGRGIVGGTKTNDADANNSISPTKGHERRSCFEDIDSYNLQPSTTISTEYTHISVASKGTEDTNARKSCIFSRYQGATWNPANTGEDDHSLVDDHILANGHLLGNAHKISKESDQSPKHILCEKMNSVRNFQKDKAAMPVSFSITTHTNYKASDTTTPTPRRTYQKTVSHGFAPLFSTPVQTCRGLYDPCYKQHPLGNDEMDANKRPCDDQAISADEVFDQEVADVFSSRKESTVNQMSVSNPVIAAHTTSANNQTSIALHALDWAKVIAQNICTVNQSNTEERMAAWTDVKEVFFPLCSIPKCDIVLRVMKQAFNYTDESVILRPCSQREQIKFGEQFCFVPAGMMLVSLTMVLHVLDSLWCSVARLHKTSPGEYGSQCDYCLPMSLRGLSPYQKLSKVRKESKDANKMNTRGIGSPQRRQGDTPDSEQEPVNKVINHENENKPIQTKYDNTVDELAAINSKFQSQYSENNGEVLCPLSKKLLDNNLTGFRAGHVSSSNNCILFPVLTEAFKTKITRDIAEIRHWMVPMSVILYTFPEGQLADWLKQCYSDYLVGRAPGSRMNSGFIRPCTEEEGRAFTRWLYAMAKNGAAKNWHLSTSRSLLVRWEDLMVQLQRLVRSHADESNEFGRLNHIYKQIHISSSQIPKPLPVNGVTPSNDGPECSIQKAPKAKRQSKFRRIKKRVVKMSAQSSGIRQQKGCDVIALNPEDCTTEHAERTDSVHLCVDGWMPKITKCYTLSSADFESMTKDESIGQKCSSTSGNDAAKEYQSVIKHKQKRRRKGKRFMKKKYSKTKLKSGVVSDLELVGISCKSESGDNTKTQMNICYNEVSDLSGSSSTLEYSPEKLSKTCTQNNYKKRPMSCARTRPRVEKNCEVNLRRKKSVRNVDRSEGNLTKKRNEQTTVKHNKVHGVNDNSANLLLGSSTTSKKGKQSKTAKGALRKNKECRPNSPVTAVSSLKDNSDISPNEIDYYYDDSDDDHDDGDDDDDRLHLEAFGYYDLRIRQKARRYYESKRKPPPNRCASVKNRKKIQSDLTHEGKTTKQNMKSFSKQKEVGLSPAEISLLPVTPTIDKTRMPKDMSGKNASLKITSNEGETNMFMEMPVEISSLTIHSDTSETSTTTSGTLEAGMSTDTAVQMSPMTSVSNESNMSDDSESNTSYVSYVASNTSQNLFQEDDSIDLPDPKNWESDEAGFSPCLTPSETNQNIPQTAVELETTHTKMEIQENEHTPEQSTRDETYDLSTTYGEQDQCHTSTRADAFRTTPSRLFNLNDNMAVMLDVISEEEPEQLDVQDLLRHQHRFWDNLCNIMGNKELKYQRTEMIQAMKQYSPDVAAIKKKNQQKL